MTRNIKVAAAQLGPIQKADTRQAVVARMLELMRQAEGLRSHRLSGTGADHVLPALALRGPQRRRHLVRARDAERRHPAAVRGSEARPAWR